MEWEKLDSETNKAYAAFWDYLSMGAGRSLRKLCQSYREQRASGGRPLPPTTNQNTLERWSSDHGWQARVTAWEAHQVAQQVAAWDKEREDNRNQRRTILRASMGKLAQALNALNPDNPDAKVDYATVMQSIKIIAEQLRIEYGDAASSKSVETMITQTGADGQQTASRVIVDLNGIDF